MKMRNLLVASLLGATAFSVSAQQPAAQPPADNGPSLAATMQFIQEKLNSLGKVSWTEFRQNASDGMSFNINFSNDTRNVVAEPSQCRISYHRTTANWNGAIDLDANSSFALHDVQEIVLKPLERSETEGIAKSGSPNIIVTSTSPAITALVVRLPHTNEYTFLFTDANLANRVAKALTHAAELCGGGQKSEPF